MFGCALNPGIYDGHTLIRIDLRAIESAVFTRLTVAEDEMPAQVAWAEERLQEAQASRRLRQLCAGLALFRPAGVEQIECAVRAGLTDDVKRAATTGAGLLRARVRADRALNQRGRAAVGKKQRIAATATAQRHQGASRQRGTDPASEGRETAFPANHVKPRSRLVFSISGLCHAALVLRHS